MSDIKRDMAFESMAKLTGPITQDMAMGMLAARLEHARREHPVFAESNDAALDIILDEAEELSREINHGGSSARVIDEALDVAATAMRLVMGEVQS